VNDFAKADLASKHLGENQRVERQQQPVVLGKLVAEYETDGNQLCRLAPAFRRHALHGVKPGLQELFGARTSDLPRLCIRPRLADIAVHCVWCLSHEVHGQPPFSGLEAFGSGWRNNPLGFRHRLLQLPSRFALVRFSPATNPFGIFVARTDFAERTKMAFSCALEVGIKDRGSDSHGWNIIPTPSLHTRHSDVRPYLSPLLPLVTRSAPISPEHPRVKGRKH
jgi:hypothetical protein